jgi:hypothetical protein
MNGQATATKANGHAAVLATALALDHGRAAKTKTKTKKGTRSKKAAQRARVAGVLAAFSTDTPRPLAEVAQAQGVRAIQLGIGALVRRRYLRAKGDGYVRTAKPYDAGAAQ